MKKCSKCGELKDLELFSIDKKKKDGRFGSCKDCVYLMQREYNQTPNGRFIIIKKGAKRRGHSFSITIDYFKKFWNKDCFYCGKKIKGVGIDRIDNSIGYEEGNLVSCCKKCNLMKLTSSKDSFISHCKKISDFQNSLS